MAALALATTAASAQQLSIAPAAGRGDAAAPGTDAARPEAVSTYRAGPDYATEVLADPWDFEEASDYVHMFSEDYSNALLSAWSPMPTLQNGRFVGTPRVKRPRLQLIFEGVAGALNVVGRTGVRYPIDTSKYKRLSFRLKRSVMPPDWFWPMWYTQAGRSGGSGTRVVAGTAASQSPVAQQNRANEWHIYKIDLDAPVDPGQTPWTAGPVLGLAIDLGDSTQLVGATIELDWVRLTERDVAVAQLSFSGFSGTITATARHQETGDVVRVFNGSGGTTFTNGTHQWDYGFLPPGTWVVTASDGSRSDTRELVVDPAPYVEILDPDAKGGRDYARTLVGDAYDMTNAEDVSRNGRTGDINNLQFTENGLTGVNASGNPYITLFDAWSSRPGTERTLDASTYRHVTFTLQYDHPEYTFLQALRREGGGIARVIWQKQGNTDGKYTNTQDIFVLDGGPQTYSMDLASFTKFCDQADCQLEPGGSQGRDLWQGTINHFEIDPNEASTPRWFRLSDVRIAADDEPNANGYFRIAWRVRDATFSREVAAASPAGSDATIALYRDTDTSATNGRVPIATVAAGQGAYDWNVATLDPGRYFVQAVVTDTAGNTQSRYSGGPVRIASTFPPLSDSSGTGMPDAWRARYQVTSPSADEDGDGLSNLTEFQQATNPLVSNSWLLPEGATGFFTERVALANPDPTPANVTLTFLRKAKAGQPAPPPIVRDYTVLGYGRLTVTANQVAGLASEEFSTTIATSLGSVVAERTMFWGDQRYGGHTGKAVKTARTHWYLAEGNAGFFDTWILLANANAQDAVVTIKYLLPRGGLITQSYTVDGSSRFTVFANAVPGLAGKDFSADISSTVPITVERAMYFSVAGRFWAGGHAAAAVEAPATEWFVAEGSTKAIFDTFLLLGNPSSERVDVVAQLLLPGGVTRNVTRTLEPFSRENLWLNVELANLGFPETDVSARVTASAPIIVERAMYWPKKGGWIEAHASAGVTAAGTLWALAEGELGTSLDYQTYVLFANPDPVHAATVKVKVLRTNGVATDSELTIKPSSRETLHAAMLGVQPGEQFGLLIESTNEVPIVVERAMYWNGGGQFWGGGTNETAVRLR
jgi:hypothetical protein